MLSLAYTLWRHKYAAVLFSPDPTEKFVLTKSVHQSQARKQKFQVAEASIHALDAPG